MLPAGHVAESLYIIAVAINDIYMQFKAISHYMLHSYK